MGRMALVFRVSWLVVLGVGCGSRAPTTEAARTAAGHADIALPALVREVSRAVVLVTCCGANGDTICQGSGFFVSDSGHIVTNAHVMKDAHRAYVRATNGNVLEVHGVVAEDDSGDLVRLTTDAAIGSVHALPMCTQLPEVGSRVLVIGSPLGLEQTVSDGIVSAIRDVPGFGPVVQISAPISPGSSGSPVVNMRGEVVGVASFYLSAGQNLNFAVPSSRVVNMRTHETVSLAASRVTDVSRKTRPQLPRFATDSIGDFSPADFCRWGTRLMWAGQYQMAEEWLTAVPTTDSFSCEARVLASCCSFLSGNYSEAVERGASALVCPWKTNVDTKMGNCVIGLALAKLGSHKASLQVLRRAGFLCEAYCGYFTVYFNLPEADRPEWPDDMRSLADYQVKYRSDLFCHFGDFDWLVRSIAADLSCRLATAVEVEDAPAWLDIAAEYLALGRESCAVRCSEWSVALAPSLPRAHLMLGVSHFYTGNATEGLRSCEQAIALDPDYIRAYFYLGDMYYQTGNLKASVQVFRRLARRHPECAEALFGRGLTAIIGSKRTAALEAYAKLKTIDDVLAARLFKYIYP